MKKDSGENTTNTVANYIYSKMTTGGNNNPAISVTLRTRDLTRFLLYCSLEYQLNYAQVHLDRLKKTNVFNTTFHIWHKGHFGTINNFRLGRLPSAPVDWSEINAAWGQTTLLLVALARKSNLTFQRYRLVPYGSHSYIKVNRLLIPPSIFWITRLFRPNFSGISRQ